MEASDGNLYGVTQKGGNGNFGSVFKINGSGTLSVIYSFTTSDGRTPVRVQLYEITVPLPVEFSEFRADIVGKEVVLNWTTQSETNNKGFTIQKSRDGERWEDIGFVAGSGSTIFSKQYIYKDSIELLEGAELVATTNLWRTEMDVSYSLDGPRVASMTVVLTSFDAITGDPQLQLLRVLGTGDLAEGHALGGLTFINGRAVDLG